MCDFKPGDWLTIDGSSVCLIGKQEGEQFSWDCWANGFFIQGGNYVKAKGLHDYRRATDAEIARHQRGEEPVVQITPKRLGLWLSSDGNLRHADGALSLAGAASRFCAARFRALPPEEQQKWLDAVKAAEAEEKED